MASMALERFNDEHQYIRIEDGSDIGVIGITVHAAEQLGEIVFCELPQIGRKLKAGEACAIVESAKTASDVFSPVSGEVMEVNPGLDANPTLANESAEDKGWLFKLRLSDGAELDKLMDRAAYEAFVAQHS
jgi:glycine cleavage system H protein